MLKSYLKSFFLFYIASAAMLCSYNTYAQSLEFNKPKYARYKVKKGDTLKLIYKKFGFDKIYSEKNFINEVTTLNTDILKPHHRPKAHSVIIIPVKNLDLRNFRISEYGLFEFSKTKRSIASADAQPNGSLEQVNFEYDCSSAENPNIYDRLSRFAKQNTQSIQNINISFKCDGNKPTYSPDLINKKLKPWMQSFDLKKPQGQQKDSHFFPTLGLENLSYKEGLFTNSFSNLFLGFKYRKIIKRPTLLLDAEIKYGVLDLNNEVDNSKAQLFEADIRLGRSFKVMSEPWHFTLFAGAYYSQLFVKDNLYGYKGIYYPQIYPEFRRIFNSGDSLQIHIKYMPTGDNVFAVSGKEYSISLGAKYNFNWNDSDLFINANYTDLRFNSPDRDIPVQMKKYFLGLGVHFD